ncbi:Protein NRT1/ PTR FAMILY 5.2 [Rhynchospora pubera]|uniref:Protein NRT1/ PTR FAMILY 5.2 n=1 Tax=Rhynchospora pubera TaxID=906938 RepID=A0AAV8EB02_9POAL|nr:Protein NRT1/ PTR FAMILY 5.2 [Rhynchospora pubera]
MAERLENGDHGDIARDGSVDLRGNPVHRSERGGWKACYFIIAYELIERMAYYSIQSNLVSYLTNKLHEGTVEAANNVTNWVGTGFLTPILGAYIADAYLGQYWTFIIGSALYLLGMIILTLAVSVPKLKPPPCKVTCERASSLQQAVFFIGLYTIAVANGCTKPNVTTLGANQFDETNPKEKMQKHSFFNWWMSSIFLGTLFSPTVLVYLQDNINFSIGYGVPTIALFVSMVIFFVGTPFYRHKLAQSSPFTKMTRVIVVSIRNWQLPLPCNGEDPSQIDTRVAWHKSSIQPTKSMRFLDKAAIKSNSDSKWTSCSITEIEETKQMISMLPILVSLILPCTMIAQINTLFVKQGATLDRHMGPHFQIPPASLVVFVTITMLVSVVLYDRYFIKVLRSWTRNPRGITILQRIGTGIFLQVMTMLFASIIEHRRLSIVNKEAHTSLSIFFLLPQFVFMGLADSFLVVGQTEFFYDQAPDSMKSLGSSYTMTAYGIGNFLSSFILQLVSDITKKQGKGWVLNDLNSSRLDYYYALLTAVNALNFIFFLFVSRMYKYRVELFSSTHERTEDEAEKGGHLEF